MIRIGLKRMKEDMLVLRDVQQIDIYSSLTSDPRFNFAKYFQFLYKWARLVKLTPG